MSEIKYSKEHEWIKIEGDVGTIGITQHATEMLGDIVFVELPDVGASVVNGGSGFTSLPDITINSDTGTGAKLRPVLKFTKVDDASQLAQITQDAVVTVISCIEK